MLTLFLILGAGLSLLFLIIMLVLQNLSEILAMVKKYAPAIATARL